LPEIEYPAPEPVGDTVTPYEVTSEIAAIHVSSRPASDAVSRKRTSVVPTTSSVDPSSVIACMLSEPVPPRYPDHSTVIGVDPSRSRNPSVSPAAGSIASRSRKSDDDVVPPTSTVPSPAATTAFASSDPFPPKSELNVRVPVLL